LFGDLLKDKRKVAAAAALIVAIAAFTRFYHIEWSFSNNGIDEGIMLQRALLVSRGYDLYSELPCDQAPLAFLIGAQLDGGVVALRSLSASLSILAILACMYAARRLQGDLAMLLTGALLALDFAFLRESRLFSLDGLSSYLLAFSLLAFIGYAKSRSRAALGLAGLLVGLSTAVKLFGGLALVGAVLFILLESRRDRSRKAPMAADLFVLVISALAPMAVLMLALGPSDMVQGMILGQGSRGFDAFLKLSVIAYFGVTPVYSLPLLRARVMWGKGPEMRLLLALSAVILAAMIVQPLSFLHHMVLLSPALSILSGVLLSETVSSKKGISTKGHIALSSKSEIVAPRAVLAVLVATLVIGAGFASYGLSKQGMPPSGHYTSYLLSLTGPDDFVITGDPLIAALAGRMMPPEVVNLAYRVGDVVTEDEVKAAILEYDVRVVVVCYRLAEMPGLVPFLEENGFSHLAGSWQLGAAGVLDLFQEGNLTFLLYARE
jgi:4-amino-4-deoxy-L-arabinose transferase-like glycosyltransferase